MVRDVEELEPTPAAKLCSDDEAYLVRVAFVVRKRASLAALHSALSPTKQQPQPPLPPKRKSTASAL
jgi:hypothetical protein